jgi:DNA polymerase-3 subunit epsilon
MDDLVIIDTETTGLNCKYHRVIEVAAVKVSKGKIVSEYSSLINITGDVPYLVTQITGITKEELNNEGRDPEEVFTEVKEFIGNSTFVAHNVNFDYRFLNAEFGRYKIPELHNTKLCTVQVARRSNLPITNFRLTTIKEYLGIDIQSHRALNDVMVCYELMKLVEKS